MSIDELKTQLDEEQNLRRVERENAEADLKAAVLKAHLETQEKLKRLSDAASRRELEQQEAINKLQVRNILVLVGVCIFRCDDFFF